MGVFEDGTGTGFRAKVNSRNQLAVQSIYHSLYMHEALNSGRAWTIPFDAVDPTGADDYFVYIRNDSAIYNLILVALNASSTVAGTLELQTVTGTPSGGSNITLVAKKIGTTLAPDITAQSGVDITGLTDGGVHEFVELFTTVWTESVRLMDRPIIIPQSQAAALLWTESTGILTGKVDVVQIPVSGL